MFAVIFEVSPQPASYQRYLDLAAALRPKLDAIDGFISIERFQGISVAGWILSLSFWRDEAALIRWRADGEHHAAQTEGRESIFTDYRIRVVRMIEGLDPTAVNDGAQAVVGLWEYPDIDPAAAPSGKLYRSLTDANKHIALTDFSCVSDATNWQAHCATAGTSLEHLRCGAVLRDYGLCVRDQAPQSFPAVAPRR